MLLGVVADLQAVAGDDASGVRGFHAGQQTQKRGLARAVQAEDDDARAAVDRQVQPGEDLQGPVALRQTSGGQRRPPARRRLGEAQVGDPVGAALAFDAGQ